jgi:hypothetical protein
MLIKMVTIRLKSRSNNKMRPFIFLVFFLMQGCLYKAGNRSPDLAYIYKTGINPYYIKEYLTQLDTSYQSNNLDNSEISNYPNKFVPIIDSILGKKYVIEFTDADSLVSRRLNYITLSSMYDLQTKKWIYSRDEVDQKDLKNFKVFFKKMVLIKTSERFKHIVPDSLLFVSQSDSLVEMEKD